MVVVDASVVAALIVDLPWSAEAKDALAGEPRLSVPSIFLAEVANAIWRNVRAGVLRPAQAVAALRAAHGIVEVEPEDALTEDALDLAIKHDHPVYDCLYIVLALRAGASLLTADRKLAALASKARVPIRLFSS
jgi:predicted nucleic acid-binding protein